MKKFFLFVFMKNFNMILLMCYAYTSKLLINSLES